MSRNTMADPARADRPELWSICGGRNHPIRSAFYEPQRFRPIVLDCESPPSNTRWWLLKRTDESSSPHLSTDSQEETARFFDVGNTDIPSAFPTKMGEPRILGRQSVVLPTQFISA